MVSVISGCSPLYVMRAAYEEGKILWRREPIADYLGKPDLVPDTEEKLRLVLQVREYAKNVLKMNVGGSYETYSYVDRPDLAFIVTAAPRTELKPYTWWFLFVGRVPYKGYFSKEDAEQAAAELQADGYDTNIRTTAAFSTLGWFDDPLMSHLLRFGKVTLAEIIFHELLHNTFFLSGETTFDESLATFAGYRATIEFFCDGDGSAGEACRTATADWQDTLTISQFFSRGLAELQSFYDSKPSGAALEEGRQRAFAEMRDSFRALKLHPGRNADFAAGPINNASLIQERIYLKDLDVFDRLYHQAGGLRRAVEEIREAVGRGGEPFARVREAAATGASPAARTSGGLRAY